MLTLDYFAGGGGASHGIREALGCDVTVAVNHDAASIAMHAAKAKFDAVSDQYWARQLRTCHVGYAHTKTPDQDQDARMYAEARASYDKWLSLRDALS